jgi:integrase
VGKGAHLIRYWLFRYKQRGTRKDRQLGIGPLATVSLAQARSAARVAREQLLAGLDPIEVRDAAKRNDAAATAKTITFDKAAERYITSHEAGWRNDKHRKQWIATLKTYADPVIGHLAVREIDTGLVMQVLQPIWTVKPETASRLRGRIGRVLGWAKVNGYRTGENPARWGDNLDHSLPARGKVRKVERHPALPHAQMPAFMAELRTRTGTSVKCLEFTILTAARTKELVGAKWQEIDFDAKVWTVPAERMKGGREHRVPLSDAAMVVIEHMRSLRQGDYVFAGDREGKMLGSTALIDALGRLNLHREKAGLPRWGDPNQGNEDVVPHGFRSSFRDWVAEETTFADDLAEAALAHVNGDKVERAYKRGDALAKRRKLMEAWAGCGTRLADAGSARRSPVRLVARRSPSWKPTRLKPRQI